MPAKHEDADKLPAVSGSSGRLIVERSLVETSEREWPGRVFEDPALTYEEAMLKFVAASQAQAKQPEPKGEAEPVDRVPFKATKRALRHQEEQLRAEPPSPGQAQARRRGLASCASGPQGPRAGVSGALQGGTR